MNFLLKKCSMFNAEFQVVHDEEKGIDITENNLADFVGKPIFTSEKMYPETPVS